MLKLSKCLLFISVLLTACTRDMNYIIEHEPNIEGTILETNEDYLLIENKQGKYSVSLDVENGDSMTHFNIGDGVKIYFDGIIAESWSMQINHVYAIVLIDPADEE